MTQVADHPAAESGPAAPAERSHGELADSLARLVHTFNRARSHMLDRARQDVEWSAQLLITTLVTRGPMRAGALAEAVQSDPSTVSRQVAALVRDGLVERRADPEDGRATLLVATPAGERVHQAHRATRDEHFAQMLAHWTPEDRQTLGTLVRRLTDDFDAYKSSLVDGMSSTSREETH